MKEKFKGSRYCFLYHNCISFTWVTVFIILIFFIFQEYIKAIHRVCHLPIPPMPDSVRQYPARILNKALKALGIKLVGRRQEQRVCNKCTLDLS